MAINIAHRPDLDRRVEALANRLGLRGKGRKTRIIERALENLEARVRESKPSPEEMDAAFAKYAIAAKEIRAKLSEQLPAYDPASLSLTLQEELYDEYGAPK